MGKRRPEETSVVEFEPYNPNFKGILLKYFGKIHMELHEKKINATLLSVHVI